MQKTNISEYTESLTLDVEKLFGDESIFIPCKSEEDDKGRTAKLPLIKDYPKKALSLSHARAFKKATMLGLRLDDYIALDCDGASAIAVLRGIDIKDFSNTFFVGRNESRGCFIFKKPKGCNLKDFRLKTPKNEFLEIRTGSGMYQIIQGIHPVTKEPYITNHKQPLEASKIVLDIIESLRPNKELREQLNCDFELNIINPFEDIRPSLITFLTKENQEAVLNGVGEGQRNNRAFILASDLIGVHTILTNLGLEFSDEPSKVYEQYCDRCDPPINSFERDRTWRSAESSEKQPTLTPDILQSRFDDWVLEIQCQLDALNTNEEIKPVNPGNDTIDLAVKKINFLVDGYDVSTLEFDAIKPIAYILCEKGKNSYKSFVEYAEERLKYRFIEYQNNRLNETLNFPGVDYNKGFRVPSLDKTMFAKPFKDLEQVNNFPFEYLFVNLLTSFSALIPENYTFRYHSGTKLNSNVFTLIVGKPASGKSRLMESFVKPFHRRTARDNNTFCDEHDNWVIAEKQFSRMKESEQMEYFQKANVFVDTFQDNKEEWLKINPEPIKPLEYCVSDATLEALRDVCCQIQEGSRGILWAADEYSKLIGTIKNYSGAGEDASAALLPVFNGDSTNHQRVANAGKKKFGVYKVSLLTSTQTERLNKFFNLKDPSGIVSRFWFMHLDYDIKSKLIYSRADTAVKPDLESAIDLMIDKASETLKGSENVVELEFEQDAFDIFEGVLQRYEPLTEELREYNVNPGLAQWLKRLPEHFAKIIIIWHLIRFCEGLEDDIKTVRIETVREMTPVIQWLKVQTESILQVISELSMANLDAATMECVVSFRDFLSRRGNSINLKDLYTSSVAKKKCFINRYRTKGATRMRLVAEELATMLSEMGSLGLGHFNSVTGEFKRL